MEIFFNAAMMLLKHFYLFICMTSFKLYFCERRIAEGIESVLGKRYMVYFVKSPYSEIDYDAWLCGGALISAQKILTASACLVEMKKIYAIAGYKKYINGGEINSDACTRYKKQRVVKIYTTKNYSISDTDPGVWANRDIGIAVVEKPYDFADMTYHIYCSYAPAPIELNYEKRYEVPGTECIFYGWGPFMARNPEESDFDDTNMKILQEGTTLIISRSECLSESNHYLRALLDNYVICTKVRGHLEGDGMDNSPSILETDGCYYRRYSLNQDINNNTCLDEEFDFRRGGAKNNQTNNTITKQLRNNKKRTKRDIIPSLCQNDHGGPLVRWIGTKEVLIGVAINGFYDTNYECRGPFIFTSIAQTAHIIKCMLAKDASARRSCNDKMEIDNDRVREFIIEWPEETVLRAHSDDVEKISSFARQGNDEMPLNMRPTKDIEQEDSQNGQSYERTDGQREEQVFGLQIKQKRAQPYNPSEDRPQDQEFNQRNEQIKEQAEEYEQVYEQPRQDATTHENSQPQDDSYSQSQAKPVNNKHIESLNVPLSASYNSPQMDSYNSPQMDSYNSPQMDSYKQPQMDSYKQPQMDSYKQPQMDSYQQHEMDSYKQPEMDSYKQPEMDSYKQPEMDSYKQPDTDSYKQPDTDSYKQPDTDSYKQPDTDSYKQPDTDSYKQPDTDSYKQPQMDSYKQPEMDSYKQPEMDSYKQPEMDSYKQPEMDSYKQPDTDSYKQPDTDSYKQPQMDSYKQPEMDSYKQPDTDSYKQPDTDSYKQPDTDSYKQPDTDSYKQPDTDSYKQPDIDSYKQPQRDSHKQPQMDSYKQPQIDSYKQPQMDTYKQPQMDTYKQPQMNSYKQPQMDSYKQPQMDSYKQPHMDSYKQPQIDTHKQPQMDTYKQPQMDTYKQPQMDTYKQPETDSYSQPRMDTYKQPETDSYSQSRMDTYKQPETDSYSQPQMDTYKQPQTDTYKQPQIESYNQPQVDIYKEITIEPYNDPKIPYHQPTFNQPQIDQDQLKFPQGDSYSPPQIQPFLPPQREPVKQLEEDIYSPDIGSFQPKIESFKLPIVEPYKSSKVEPYDEESFDPYKINNEQQQQQIKSDSYDPPLLRQTDQSPEQPTPQPQSSSIKKQELTETVDALRERPREPILAPPFELSRDDPQSFEQMYSQLHAPSVEMPTSPAPEQTFEDLYKSLHDPTFDLPHDQDIAVPHEQPKEQLFDQRFEQGFEQPFEQIDQQFDQLVKQPYEQTHNVPAFDPDPVETQPYDKAAGAGGQDEVKVRPQRPLDYQNEEISYSVRSKDSA